MRTEPFPLVSAAPASPLRSAAVLAVLLCVVVLAVLPAAVAVGVAGGLPLWLGGLTAVVAGAKVAAAVWGLLMRVRERPRLRAVAASID